MMHLDAIHHIIALVVAAGHHRDVVGNHRVHIIPRLHRGGRVLDADDPGGLAAVCRGIHHPDIAAAAHGKGGKSIGIELLGDLLSGIALGNRAQIQRGLGVSEIDCPCLPVNDQAVDVSVPGSCFQFLHGRQFTVLGADVPLPVLMPDLQHRSHADIHSSLGLLLPLHTLFQQVDERLVHLDRSNTGIVIDGLDIVHAFIAVVAVKELIIIEKQFMHLFGIAVEILTGMGIAHILHNGIKGIHIRDPVTAPFRLRF